MHSGRLRMSSVIVNKQREHQATRELGFRR